MEKRVVVKIDAYGNPTIDAQNFAGVGCEQATRYLEAQLAGNVSVDRSFKPEYYGEDQKQEQNLTW